MDANAILEKIVQEGAEQAQKIIEDAKSKANELTKASEDRISQQTAAARQRAQKDGEELCDRMLRMAELDWKKDSLSAKRSVLDKTFDRALEEMNALAPAELRALFARLAKENASGTEKVLVGNQSPAWYDDGFLDEVNAALVKAGKPGELKKDSAPLEGVGFALVQDGMNVDCTLASLLSQKRAALEIDVSRVLFG